MTPGMAQTQELTHLMAEIERDLSALIQAEYESLLDSMLHFEVSPGALATLAAPSASELCDLRDVGNTSR